MENEKTWIICVGGSDVDGIDVVKFTGTRSAVIDRIWSIMETMKTEDDYEDDEDMQCPKDSIDEGDRIYGYVVFHDHHVDIEAYEIDEIKENADFYSSAAAKPIWYEGANGLERV